MTMHLLVSLNKITREIYDNMRAGEKKDFAATKVELLQGFHVTPTLI